MKGKGAQIRPLSKGGLREPRKIEKKKAIDDLSKLRFADRCRLSLRIATRLPKIGNVVGSYPHIQYATEVPCLDPRACEVVLRTPKSLDSPSHVWDHAGGVMVFEEAGGKATDLNGKDLVFAAGRDLIEKLCDRSS